MDPFGFLVSRIGLVSPRPSISEHGDREHGDREPFDREPGGK